MIEIHHNFSNNILQKDDTSVCRVGYNHTIQSMKRQTFKNFPKSVVQGSKQKFSQNNNFTKIFLLCKKKEFFYPLESIPYPYIFHPYTQNKYIHKYNIRHPNNNKQLVDILKNDKTSLLCKSFISSSKEEPHMIWYDAAYLLFRNKHPK